MRLILLSLLLCLASSAYSTNDDTVKKVLPLPDVPSGLTGPKERADYIIAHFWDKMDFADTLLSHDRGFMEQSMANYFSLFPHADEDSLSANISYLLRSVVKDSTAFSLIEDLAEQYLYEDGSPMRKETHYMRFLEAELGLSTLSGPRRERAAFRLEHCRKNLPGTVVADFHYIDRHGSTHSLYGMAGMVLLFFYDPACHHCEEVAEELRRSEALHCLIAERQLSVLAVSVGSSREEWVAAKGRMPEEWTDAFDMSGVAQRQLFSFSSLPSMYLLDEDKRVVLKEPTPVALNKWLCNIADDED